MSVSCLRHCVSVNFTGPGCVAFVNSYPGLQSILATQMPQVVTGDTTACENGCRADPTCLSYQINTNPGQVYCWYQRILAELDPNRMADQLGVVEYIKTSCSCKFIHFNISNYYEYCNCVLCWILVLNLCTRFLFRN